ncbi:MAG: hypothetical protein M3014_08440 [Chloroflexota bacterium]|nr:hypothetical protein [Chloroflexota bacterium]
MAEDFYDDLVFEAGQLAEEYGATVSDVLGLLLYAGRNEGAVRRALAESKNSDEARAAAAEGRTFDLAESARKLLPAGGEQQR